MHGTLGWLALTGCFVFGNDDPDPTLAPGPEDTAEEVPTTDTMDSPETSEPFDPGAFFVDGFGLYDPEQDAFSGTVQGNGFPAERPGLVFLFLDRNDPYLFCQVLLTPTSGTMPAAAWTDGTSAIRGFELAPGEADVVDGCSRYALPPEYAEGLGNLVAKWTWGFGIRDVADELAQELEEFYDPADWAEIEPFLLGSVQYGNGYTLTDIESSTYDLNEAEAYAVDADGALVPDDATGGPLALRADETLLSGEEVARSYLVFLGFLGVDSVLLTFDVP